jgi:hypothetical protein
MRRIFPERGGNERARSDVQRVMQDKGIPPFVMAFAVMVALLLLPALLGS